MFKKILLCVAPLILMLFANPLLTAQKSGGVTGTNAMPTKVSKVYTISHCPVEAAGMRVAVANKGKPGDLKYLKKDEDFYYVEERAEIILLKDISMDPDKEYLFVMGTKIEDAPKGKTGKKSAPKDRGDGSCAITGTVLDNKGKAVKGASLNISCHEHGFQENMKTGKDGTYAVENLKAGFYSIILKKGRNWNSRHKMERLEPGQEITLDFAPLEDAGALCGEILNLKGKPIKNCTVRLNNINFYQKARVEMINDNTETDSTGFFVFDNLPPCQYVVSIYKRGEVQSSPAGIIETEKGVEKEVTFKIQPGKAKGKVKFQGDRPAGKSNINLWAVKEDDFGGPQWSTRPEENGSFELMNLSPGSYEVKATCKGYYCKPVVFKVSKKGKAKDFEILLMKAGSILFKVTDKRGNPLDHINVSKIIPGKGSSSVLMDKVKEGQFRVFSVEPGKHEFHVSASGMGNTKTAVAVKAAEEVIVDVEI